MLLETFKHQGIPGLWSVDVPVAENESLQIQMVSMYVLDMGCFLKWWYPTTMGFPTALFGVFLGVPPFKETPIIYIYISISIYIIHT